MNNKNIYASDLYASVDVFNLHFYDNEDYSLLFSIETAQKTMFSRDFYKDIIYLDIYDNLINNELMNEILNGVYDDKTIRIFGTSKYRDLDYIDRDFILDVKESKISDYSLDLTNNRSSVSFIRFSIDTLTSYKKPNVSLKEVER